jgi:hypothetical protein
MGRAQVQTDRPQPAAEEDDQPGGSTDLAAATRRCRVLGTRSFHYGSAATTPCHGHSLGREDGAGSCGCTAGQQSLYNSAYGRDHWTGESEAMLLLDL